MTQDEQVNRITVSEFQHTAGDVLKLAKGGEQTIVENPDGKTLMVIGTKKRSVFIIEEDHFEELEGISNRRVDSTRWFC